jgi:hypothetical protein
VPSNLKYDNNRHKFIMEESEKKEEDQMEETLGEEVREELRYYDDRTQEFDTILAALGVSFSDDHGCDLS